MSIISGILGLLDYNQRSQMNAQQLKDEQFNLQQKQNAINYGGLAPTINPTFGQPVTEQDDTNPSWNNQRYLPLTQQQALYNPDMAHFVNQQNASVQQGLQDQSITSPFINQKGYNGATPLAQFILTGGNFTGQGQDATQNAIEAAKYGLPEQDAKTTLAQQYGNWQKAGTGNQLGLPASIATQQNNEVQGDIQRNPITQSALNDESINRLYQAHNVTPYEQQIAEIQLKSRLGTQPTEEAIREQALSNQQTEGKTQGIYANSALQNAPLGAGNQRLETLSQRRNLLYSPPASSPVGITPTGQRAVNPYFVPVMQSMQAKLGNPSDTLSSLNNNTIPLGNGLHIIPGDTNTPNRTVRTPLVGGASGDW